MIERHAQYLEDLRVRHTADLEIFSRALAGRRPGLLRAFRKGQAATERETVRIFTVIGDRSTGGKP